MNAGACWDPLQVAADAPATVVATPTWVAPLESPRMVAGPGAGALCSARRLRTALFSPLNENTAAWHAARSYVTVRTPVGWGPEWAAPGEEPEGGTEGGTGSAGVIASQAGGSLVDVCTGVRGIARGRRGATGREGSVKGSMATGRGMIS